MKHSHWNMFGDALIPCPFDPCPPRLNIEATWNTYVRLPLPWVRTLPPEYWANQKVGDPHGPDKYQNLQPESYLLLEMILSHSQPHQFILDLGCGPGRHMKALRRRGYSHVSGMDIAQTFELGLPKIPPKRFDLIFSFGTTIELIPPSFPICSHMARITSHAIVLMIHETHVPYPRLWKHEFEREGFDLTTYQPAPVVRELSLFVFERPQ